MPAAVATGYASYSHSQPLSLELVELSTGRVMFNEEYATSYGKAIVQPLPIRLSGEGQLAVHRG